MTAVATPVQLPLLRVRARVVTLTRAAVRERCQVDDYEIDEFLSRAHHGWAWNIATPDAERAELRFLSSDIARWVDDEPVRCRPLAEVVRELFGDEKPFVDGINFYRAFNCDSQHVYNLIDCRPAALGVLPNTERRRGPNGSAAIAWASAVEFVKERKL